MLQPRPLQTHFHIQTGSAGCLCMSYCTRTFSCHSIIRILFWRIDWLNWRKIWNDCVGKVRSEPNAQKLCTTNCKWIIKLQRVATEAAASGDGNCIDCHHRRAFRTECESIRRQPISRMHRWFTRNPSASCGTFRSWAAYSNYSIKSHLCARRYGPCILQRKKRVHMCYKSVAYQHHWRLNVANRILCILQIPKKKRVHISKTNSWLKKSLEEKLLLDCLFGCIIQSTHTRTHNEIFPHSPVCVCVYSVFLAACHLIVFSCFSCLASPLRLR